MQNFGSLACENKFWIYQALSIIMVYSLSHLTHLPPDKMAVISQTTFSNAFLWIEKLCILIPISLKFVPKVAVDYKSALVQVMAWHQTGEKPLSEPMSSLYLVPDLYVRCSDHKKKW